MSQFNGSWHNAPEGSENFLPTHRDDRSFDSYNRGPELRLAALPNVSRSPSALEQPSHPASLYLGRGIGTSYATLIQDSSPSNYLYQTQSASPAQAAGYDIHQIGIYLGLDPNSPYPAQQLSSSFQSRAFHPNLNTGNFAPSPLPPHYQPAQDGRKWGNAADYSGAGPHACDICRIRFKRKADLNRHLKTARAHNLAPHGPACPELGCNYIGGFTRVDNFRVHYRKQHGKNDDEVDWFIQEWKSQGSP